MRNRGDSRLPETEVFEWALGRGLESTEYEPEQFPSLVYCPSGADSAFFLYASGHVVITGSPNLDAAEQTFSTLRDEVIDLVAIE